MNSRQKATALVGMLSITILITGCATTPAKFTDARSLFETADQSRGYFSNSYGYALFPTVGKGAVGIGGARGAGGVFRNGQLVGETTITELSAGFQLGGQTYSQIIFLKDERAFEEFCDGSLEFEATASAIALTASVGASASSAGSSSTRSKNKSAADVYGGYHKGAAVFTVNKAGLMYEVSLGGQRFKTYC